MISIFRTMNNIAKGKLSHAHAQLDHPRGRTHLLFLQAAGDTRSGCAAHMCTVRRWVFPYHRITIIIHILIVLPMVHYNSSSIELYGGNTVTKIPYLPTNVHYYNTSIPQNVWNLFALVRAISILYRNDISTTSYHLCSLHINFIKPFII